MKMRNLLPILMLIMPSFSAGQSVQKVVTIAVQPFGDIPPSYVSYVYKKLHQINPNVVINSTIPLPRAAYYPPRNRYRADSLVIMIARTTPNGQVTVGLTVKDISCTKGTYKDWGIFGLSYCPGKSCVASSFRTKVNKADGLYYTAIHELGHTQGLDHCPDKQCLMHDFESHSLAATKFCSNCRSKLIAKGWKI